MKIIEVNIRAMEPLIITNGSAEGMAHSCLDFIPGSKLLGAFAAIWIQNHKAVLPDDSEEFQKLFLSGKVSWGSAYPLCESKKCVPVPLSFMREKSMNGLPLPGEKADKKAFAVFNSLPLEDDENLKDLFHERIGDKDAPAKFKKLSATFMQPEIMRQALIQKIWNTRVALDEQRCAQESQLFGFFAIAAGTTFSADIYCNDDELCNLLKKMILANKSVRIGHARSAGYGNIELELGKCYEADTHKNALREFNLFLLSDYLPDPAWENSFDNLLQSLGQAVGQKISIEKNVPRQNVAFRQIEGFDSHWHKWRDTRQGLQAGSVLRISLENEAFLKNEFMLGADTHEAYGRILINPPFLQDVEPDIPYTVHTGEDKTSLNTPPDGPIVKILRERAIERFARQQALQWLEKENWQAFLDSASKLDYPTASQRANLLKMDKESFKSLLNKSAQDQWTSQVCVNPFGKGKDFLKNIIEKLLDHEQFLRAFPQELDTPLFVTADKPLIQAYELFKHHLIRVWGKSVRTRQSKQGGEA